MHTDDQPRHRSPLICSKKRNHLWATRPRLSDEPPMRCTKLQHDALAKVEKQLRELASQVDADPRACTATNARIVELNTIVRDADIVPAEELPDPLRLLKSLSRNQLVAMAHALRLEVDSMPRAKLMRAIFAEILATTEIERDDPGDAVA
jgi:hypothetical protein